MSRSGVTSPAIDGHAPTAAALASRSLCAIHLLMASSLPSDQPSLCEGCLVRGTIPRSEQAVFTFGEAGKSGCCAATTMTARGQSLHIDKPGASAQFPLHPQ